MKKIIAISLACVIVFALTACGNMSLGLGNFEYNVIHVCDHAGNCKDYRIHKWYENGTGIEVTLTNGNNLYLSEGTYILAKDNCPICEDGE